MIYLKTEGLILGKHPKGETDALIYILTKKFGSLNLIARGLRKTDSRLLGLCQAGTVAKIFFATNFRHHQLISLLGYKFPGLGFKRYPYIYLWTMYFLRSWKFLEISESFWQSLIKLEQQLSHQPRGFQIWFSLQILKELGAEPNFRFCHQCGRLLSQAFYLNATIVCFHCRKPSYEQLSQDDLTQLQQLANSRQPIYPYPVAAKTILNHHIKLVRQTN
jgi:recombinational DNA repair protein (RecF pathway)